MVRNDRVQRGYHEDGNRKAPGPSSMRALMAADDRAEDPGRGPIAPSSRPTETNFEPLFHWSYVRLVRPLSRYQLGILTWQPCELPRGFG